MKPEPFKRRAFIKNNVATTAARLRAALAQPVQAQSGQTAAPSRVPELQAGTADKPRQLG